MRKFILSFLLPLLTFTAVSAYDFRENGISYNITDADAKTVAVTKKGDIYDTYSGDIVIPETVLHENVEYRVTAIEESAFSTCMSLTGIEIPNSIVSIGKGAFTNCTRLDSIFIPASVTTIGIRIFGACNSLTSIVVDENNLVYDSRENCNGIIETSINKLVQGCDITVIPNSVTTIGEEVFYSSNKQSIVIPNNVTTIEKKAFRSCRKLTSLELPDNLTTIGDEAFYDCRVLKSIDIPNSVTTIGSNAFGGCDSITSIVLPSSLTTISKNLFKGCDSLKSVVIPNGITTIDESAFQDCIGLTQITLPESLTTIGKSAFYMCTALSEITIPQNVSSIGMGAINFCNSLSKITVHASNTVYDSRNNCNAIIETATDSLVMGCRATLIPEDITSIGDRAFYSCKSMTMITIPENVTAIGKSAFYGCSAMTEITSLATTPPTIQSSTFQNVDKTIPLYVPDNCVEAYQTAEYWKEFSNINPPILVDSIALDKDSVNMVIGDSLTLVATITPDSVTNSKVAWSSNNTAVATVDSVGNVIAVAEGTAIITVATTDGSNLTAQCKVVVELPIILVDSIALDKDSVNMVVGDSLTLVATITPDSVTNSKVAWSSSNTAVATVDSVGNVIAVAEGTAIITVATTDGSNLTAQCVIEVKQASGINNTNAECVAITVENGTIVVKNAPIGSVVNIYTITGSVAATAQVAEPITRVTVNAQGIYIVRVDNTVKKVVL